MSYIHINEVDKTIQDLAPAQSDNIVYVPLNSTDGPSGVYNVLQSYSDFVAIYGDDPSPNSTEMTSWDFAANLLLRKMPVMVRRITRVIDDEGNDTDTFLPGAALSSGLLKVSDVIGVTSATTEAKTSESLSVIKIDPAQQPDLNWSNNGTCKIEVYSSNTVSTSSSNKRGNGIAVRMDGVEYNVDVPEATGTYSQGGGFSLYNASETDPVYLSTLIMGGLKYDSQDSALIDAELASTNKTVLLDSKNSIKEKLVSEYDSDENNAPILKPHIYLSDLLENGYVSMTDAKGNILKLNQIQVVPIKLKSTVASLDDFVAAIKLPAGATLNYTLNFGDSYFCAELIQDPSNKKEAAIEIETFVSTRNNSRLCNSISLLTSSDTTAIVPFDAAITFLPVEVEDAVETVETAHEFDSNGNINLFKMYYRYVGENGNRFSAALKTIQGDGIYLHVYSGNQRVENVQLVNFRYKTTTGKYAYYDPYTDRDVIWKKLLSNFGITEGSENGRSLVTNYLEIVLNDKIDTSFTAYIDCVYMCRGDVAWPLFGGSCPTHDCVQHEVHKTYAPLKDKYLYDIKFVSNGGFVDAEVMPASIVKIPKIDEDTRWIEDAQVELAESRGDCIAFIDIPNGIDKESALEYFTHLSTSYATSYAPWIKLNLLTRTTKWCPPSFAALWTIAKSINNGNKVYAPPAGVNRAHLGECEDLAYQVPSEYIDKWQDNYNQFINPIVYINGYGVNIFGQKTLYNKVDASGDQESAMQYLNVRLVANEVKKRIFKSCIELTFEYNNLHTWLAFKSKMSVLLDALLYDNAISYYDMRMDESTMTDTDIRSNHIVGIVSIAVTNTAEKFDITFELMPNQVNFINIDYSSNSSDNSYNAQY